MARRSTAKNYIGIQWDAGSWDDAPLWCDFLFQKLEKIPVHWNFPAFPQDGQLRRRAAFIRALRGRLQDNGDTLAPMGFAGAYHPLLSLDELEKELSWSLKNPWSTGIVDALQIRSPLLFPRIPDLKRSGALEAYTRHGFTVIGMAGSCEPARRLPSGITVVPFLRLPVISTRPEDPRIHRQLAQGGAFLMIDLSGLTTLAPLEHAFADGVAPFLSLGADTFSIVKPAADQDAGSSDPAPARAAPHADPVTDWSLFPAPMLRAKIEAAAALSRKKRKKIEEYQDLLSTLSPFDRTKKTAREKAAVREGEMRLVAHMLGDVVLAGSTFDVRLNGGRFCGLVRAGKAILPLRPASSWMKIDGKTFTFRTKNSFSFEGDDGTGLREDLRLEECGGADLSVEYSFLDDSPMLTIHAEVCWPKLKPDQLVDEHVPLAMSLLEVGRGQSVAIETEAPDESAATYTVRETDGWIAVPGAVHRIGLPDGRLLLLSSAPRETRSWGLFFYRIARCRGGRVLEVNPFGSYAPIQAGVLGAGRERFSLLLGLEGKD